MPRVNAKRLAADPLVRRFLTKKKYAETTRDRGRWYLNHYTDWARRQDPPLDLVEADTEDLERYLEEREAEGMAPGTMLQHVRWLRSFYRWCYDRRELDGDNPAARLELPDVPETPARELTFAEHVAMIATLDRRSMLGRRDAAILETLRSTGMRRSELVALNRDDVDLDAGVVRLTVTKSGEVRLNDLDEGAVDELAAYLRRRRDDCPAVFVSYPARGRRAGSPRLEVARRLDPATVSYAVATAGERALGRRVGCHEYRRALSSWWIEQGGSQQGLERHNGWAPGSRQVRRYTRAHEQRIAVDEAKRLRAAAAERSRRRHA